MPSNVMVLKHDSAVNRVTFSPDEKYIATASADNTACVWNKSTGKEIFYLEFNGAVNYIAFSPDGKYIATASADNTAVIWDASWDASANKIHTLRHGYSVLKSYSVPMENI